MGKTMGSSSNSTTSDTSRCLSSRLFTPCHSAISSGVHQTIDWHGATPARLVRRDYDQQIEIAAAAGIATNVRAEKDDFLSAGPWPRAFDKLMLGLALIQVMVGLRLPHCPTIALIN
jgi:hypothetical protein